MITENKKKEKNKRPKRLQLNDILSRINYPTKNHSKNVYLNLLKYSQKKVSLPPLNPLIGTSSLQKNLCLKKLEHLPLPLKKSDTD
jgi:hypothetical protein